MNPEIIIIAIVAAAIVAAAIVAAAHWHQKKRTRQAAELIAQLLETDSKRNSTMELIVAQIDGHEDRITAAERIGIALDRCEEMTGGRFDLCEGRLAAIEGDAKRLNALCVDIENRRAQDRADWNVRADKIDKALSRGSDAARRHDDLLATANSKIDQAINERKITRELVDNAIAAHDDAIARRIDACATKPALDGLGKRLAKVESSENRFEHAAKKADELDGWRTDIAKSHMRLVGDMGQALRMLDSQATRIGALEAAQPQAQIVADLAQEVAEMRASPTQSRAASQSRQVKDIARALEELQSKFIEGLGDGDDSVPAIMQRRGAEIEALLDIAQHNADTLDLLQRRIIVLESADPGEARNRVIAEAYHAGLGSYTEIGLAFGVSRRTALRYAKRYPKTEPQEE